jgi:hypothetical protein
MKTYETLPSDLLDEYKICQQKAGGVADTVWKTAIVLGVGSIVGLLGIADVAVANRTIPPVGHIGSARWRGRKKADRPERRGPRVEPATTWPVSRCPAVPRALADATLYAIMTYGVGHMTY